jgi:putative ATPase subunit gpP of terminase
LTRPHADVCRVAELYYLGFSKKSIARQTGVSRGTIREWIGSRRWEGSIRQTATRHVRFHPDGSCEHVADLPSGRYSYLLGMYLGDGHIVRMRREVYKLRIFCDTSYPGIIDEVAAAMSAVLPASKVGLYSKRGEGCLAVASYSKNWPCFFPQHGPGMKYHRPIILESWQRSIVEAHPEQFLRGLIHSDGCRVINRVKVRGKWYEYPRYEFSNRSDDILALFGQACDQLGISWRPNNRWNLSVARRESVALLDTFVGPKA